ncbi:putative addiction module antidote protein [Dyella sp. LX-66]|uniref:addiction module antidote protein n=1 Tax=unclassified Dyella TaxID=2634549 RepID=UPI001BDF73EB|nr:MULTISPECIES: addiction module antidote protein [unclassified Dyella]MBT2119793.1 putative addiction module antidote protein [Dyella sp. LX-1]MBT2142270.1 putative addiction module antidote protein [Dyella sp. LX-66]
MNTKVKEFDAADYLDNEEVIAAYLQDALEDGDPNVFLLAVADVVKARSMTQVSQDSGLGRESLYKTIKPGARPGFATVTKLLGALGVKLQAVPARKAAAARKAAPAQKVAAKQDAARTRKAKPAKPAKPVAAKAARKRTTR